MALAEAVAEKDGRLTVGDGLAAESDDGSEDVGRGWEHVVRQAVGRLHDEDVGAGCGAFLGGETGSEFEISGIKEPAVVGVREEGLSGAVDVAGGVKRDGGVGRELLGLLKREDVLDALAGHAGAHEAGGAGGAENFAVRREVIKVRVRDERARRRVVGVEPPIDLGKIKASGEKLDIPGHRFAEREEDGEVPGGCKRERRNFG